MPASWVTNSGVVVGVVGLVTAAARAGAVGGGVAGLTVVVLGAVVVLAGGFVVVVAVAGAAVDVACGLTIATCRGGRAGACEPALKPITAALLMASTANVS